MYFWCTTPFHQFQAEWLQRRAHCMRVWRELKMANHSLCRGISCVCAATNSPALVLPVALSPPLNRAQIPIWMQPNQRNTLQIHCKPSLCHSQFVSLLINLIYFKPMLDIQIACVFFARFLIFIFVSCGVCCIALLNIKFIVCVLCILLSIFSTRTTLKRLHYVRKMLCSTSDERINTPNWC